MSGDPSAPPTEFLVVGNAEAETCFGLCGLEVFSDAECTEQLLPEDAQDSSHFGCCGTGCVAGVEVGACCCERVLRGKVSGSEEPPHDTVDVLTVQRALPANPTWSQRTRWLG